MSTLTDIEKAICELDREDFEQLRLWLVEYEKDAWDWQIEADAVAGQLDAFADDAIRANREKRTRSLPAEKART